MLVPSVVTVRFGASVWTYIFLSTYLVCMYLVYTCLMTLKRTTLKTQAGWYVVRLIRGMRGVVLVGNRFFFVN